jgi:hypothetical protein
MFSVEAESIVEIPDNSFQGGAMLFVSEYRIAPENRNVAQERFMKTCGPPPQGVKVIGRWHSAVGGRGVTVYEANDALMIAQWAQQWSDVISFEIYAAIDDAAFFRVIA